MIKLDRDKDGSCNPIRMELRGAKKSIDSVDEKENFGKVIFEGLIGNVETIELCGVMKIDRNSVLVTPLE